MRPLLIVTILISLVSFNLSSQSFQKQSIASGKSLTGISMVNTTVGFAGGVDGVYKTTDGGQNWALLPYFIETGDIFRDYYPLNFNVVHFHFFNELEGYAYGWHSYNQEIIFYTTDGGATWAIKHLENPDTPHYAFHYLNSHHVWNKTSLIIAGNTARILKTTDSGEHWKGTTIDEDDIDLRQIQFTSDTHGYTAGETRFYTSDDGGETWSKHDLNFTIVDFHFFNELKGLALGENGYFYETSDGGKNWLAKSMQAEGKLINLKFSSELIGYACGEKGLIYKTTDGGKTWLKVYNDGKTIVSSSLISSEDIWFTAEYEFLIHSTNGGTTTLNKPSITSTTINTAEIGSVIGIRGNALSSVTNVKFNGLEAAFRLSGDSIVSIVPSQASTGKIELVWPNGSVFSSSDFFIPKKPQVQYPNGLAIGGTSILIGENLQYVTELSINGFSLPFTSTATTITFSLPSDFFVFDHTRLKITSPYGTVEFGPTLIGRPRIHNINSITAPGKIVLLEGDNLSLTSAVRFGNIPASFQVLSNTQVQCTVPVFSDKTVTSITITTPSGDVTTPGDFTIFPAPILESITPSSLKAGEYLTVNGKFLPVAKWSGSYKIGGLYVNESNVHSIDENSLQIKMPFVSSGDVSIDIINEGGLRTVKSFPMTITGELPYKIDDVSPLKTDIKSWVAIKGYFAWIDSVMINGVKQLVVGRYDNLIYIQISEKTTNGILTLFKDGKSYSYPQELEIGNAMSPRFNFSPKEASVGTIIKIDPINLTRILSVKVNGKSVPFSPLYDVKGGDNISFAVSDKMSTGHISITTIDGTYTNDELLRIVPASEVRPIINNYTINWPADKFIMTVTGHNFNNVTKARYDQLEADFKIVNDDTILLEKPKNIDVTGMNTWFLTLESPAGFGNIWCSIMSSPTQLIRSVTPTIAKQGSYVTIKLAPKKPYFNFPDWYHFFFGKTLTMDYNKVNDTTYVVQVPREGDVEGPVGVYESGFVFYSDINFKLSSSGYCTALGGGQLDLTTGNEYIAGLKKIMIQGNKSDVPNKPYIDLSAEPLNLIPGQTLRVGVLGTNIGTSTKIYADWNADTDFNEPEISLNQRNAFAPADSMIYLTLTVPSNAPIGKSIKLRFVNTSSGDIFPCGLCHNGQVIDYQINIKAPSNTLKVTDFYPIIGVENTIVTATGDDFNDLISVAINNLPLQIIDKNVHTVRFRIPQGITGGPIVFNTNTQSVTTKRNFTIDNSILDAEDTTRHLKYTYRAFINGKDVPFYIGVNSWPIYNYVAPSSESLEEGILCFDTPKESKCYNETLHFPPSLNIPNPFIAKPGETIKLSGRYLNEFTGLTFDEISIPFMVQNDTLSFVAPDGNVGGHNLLFSCMFFGQPATLTYDPAPETPCILDTVYWEGYDITSLKFNQISNTSAKNTTGGISDYSDKIIIAEQYNAYYPELELKNYNSTDAVNVVVSVVINGTDTLGRYIEKYIVGNSDLITLSPNSQSIVHPYFAIPETLPIGKKMGIWFIVNTLYNGCDFNVGETEKYSIVITSAEDGLLKISSMDHTLASVNQEVQITGTHFDDVKTLQIGDVYVPFTFVSPGTIKFNVPPNSETGYVKVSSYSGFSAFDTELKVIPLHTITSIDPGYGKPGDWVTINGENLQYVNLITFENSASVDFTIFNKNKIQVKVPDSAKTGAISLSNEIPYTVKSSIFTLCDGIIKNQYCKFSQTITFNELNPIEYSKTKIKLNASATSALTVTITSSNPSVAAVSGTDLVLTGVGNTTITAIQNGDDSYYPAKQIERVLIVGRANQSIMFSVSDVSLADMPLTLKATASSGLSVRFTSNGNISIDGNSLNSEMPGKVTVSALQDGDDNYFPATSVDRSFCILPLKPSITVTESSAKNFTITSSSASNNHWYKDGKEIPNESNQILHTTEPGLYQVKVIAGDCASEFSDSESILVTGMPEQFIGSLYPNPVRSKLIIDYQKTLTKIVILGIAGQIIKSITVSKPAFPLELDLSELRSGMYIIEMNNNEKLIHRQKFVKE